MDNFDKTGVYAIINKINGKVYIGSAQNTFKHRYQTHLRLLKENKHHSILLQRAFNKYSIKNFKFKIIELCNENILDREQYWLDYYESYNPDKGYNICQYAHSTKGFKHSDELKEKLSKERFGKDNPYFGYTHTDEVKEKIGKKKRKLTLEECFEIKRLLLNGCTIKEIMEFNYPISDSNIKHIRQGRHWSSKELGGGINDWRKEFIK